MTGEEALTKAMVYTGQGIFTGALTTAGAFIAMAFTNFKGIQEMGIIRGGGLLVCFIPMMTLLPVMLLRGLQNSLDHQKPSQVEARARIENLWSAAARAGFGTDCRHASAGGLPTAQSLF